ncbi:MAG: DUF1579 family protein [Gemmatimonadales bacterium]|nr:DUF1579 family protein [Gemmatimonadales bacterium]
MSSRHTSSAFALLLPLAFLPSPLVGQNTPPPGRSCAAAEYHQFDFWIGRWDVTLPNDKRAGFNRIEPILGGCALRETWSGAGGSDGTSYNAYDASRRRWHQTWVDNQGNLLLLEGGFANGRMTLEGETLDSTGQARRQRIVWQQTSPGHVRQLWETSGDGGATWTTAFDGRYVKR